MKELRPFLPKGAVTFFLSLLLFSTLQFAQECSYIWTQQSSGTTNILYTVKAVTPLVCWTAGANATVRRTTDGGTTWLNANPNPGVISGNIDNMEAINENTAWVAVSNQISTTIYRTSNGGNNWSIVHATHGGFIKGIRMVDQNNGFAVGNPIGNIWQVLLTSDGGNTWQISPNAPTAVNAAETGTSNSLQVELPNIWWGTSLTTIRRSTDGGLTFTVHPTPGAGIYVFSVHFNSGTIGLVAGTSMSKSTDAGSSFASHPSMGAGNIDGIEGAGSEFWYIRGEHFYRSTNNGINWTLVHSASLTQKHLDFPNSLTGCQMGWSVGYGGTIYKMTGSLVSAGNEGNTLPEKYELHQNYPNPFNPVTNINFALPQAGNVDLRVYSVLGSEISVIVNGYMPAGNHTAQFDASSLASGIYYYTMKSGDFSNTKKMLLIK